MDRCSGATWISFDAFFAWPGGPAKSSISIANARNCDGMRIATAAQHTVLCTHCVAIACVLLRIMREREYNEIILCCYIFHVIVNHRRQEALAQSLWIVNEYVCSERDRKNIFGFVFIFCLEWALRANACDRHMCAVCVYELELVHIYCNRFIDCWTYLYSHLLCIYFWFIVSWTKEKFSHFDCA